ncbi:MAG: NAD(P)H-dependent oxidoreductase [Enhydrobacter sp.]|nr:NAD(P)H-dependent oxidoreductase [Enhydrobacter sp.]
MADQANENWQRLGAVEDLKKCALQQLEVGRVRIALSYRDGEFGAVSGVCNHAGGPLGQGSLKDDYIVCPWHNWMFHRSTGQARPGVAAAVPSHALRIQGEDLYIDLTPVTRRIQAPHVKHPLSRAIVREPGPLRVAGISTTAMNREFPRYSTSEGLLQTSLGHAREAGMETRLIRLNDLRFRACEGYYSKSAHACTWPCTITQMDATDQLDAVYEALVFWADIVLIATPIRWGGPGSLYVKMTERLNCVQNQITIHDRVLIRNKVAAFIVIGGQDNVQAVVGQMMMFFGELGFSFPPFPFIAHSRGWSAEDMENHISEVRNSAELHQGARELVDRCVELAGHLVKSDVAATHVARGGRKAHPLDSEDR